MSKKCFYIAAAFVVKESGERSLIKHLIYSYREVEAEDVISAKAANLSWNLKQDDVVCRTFLHHRHDLIQRLPNLGDSEKDDKDKLIAVIGTAYMCDEMQKRHHRLMISACYAKTKEIAKDATTDSLYVEFPLADGWEGHGMVAEIFSATLIRGYVEEARFIKGKVSAFTAPMQHH